MYILNTLLTRNINSLNLALLKNTLYGTVYPSHILMTLQERLDIKKDQKGMVFIQGSVVKTASNNKELLALFEEGSKNRHTASTSENNV